MRAAFGSDSAETVGSCLIQNATPKPATSAQIIATMVICGQTFIELIKPPSKTASTHTDLYYLSTTFLTRTIAISMPLCGTRELLIREKRLNPEDTCAQALKTQNHHSNRALLQKREEIGASRHRLLRINPPRIRAVGMFGKRAPDTVARFTQLTRAAA
jgi:hypothetical protein